MPQRKKESAASVTARSKRFRERKLLAQRVKFDALYRRWLQDFYQKQNIDSHAFVPVDDFYNRFLHIYIDREEFVSALRYWATQIETETVVLNDAPIIVIRPRYMLSD
jgi:hypothetical protein